MPKRGYVAAGGWTCALAILLLVVPRAAEAAAPCRASAPPGGDWPVLGHDPANTRTQPAERLLTAAHVPSLQPAWIFSTGASFQSTPIVSGGCVFVGSSSGVAYGLDAATGRPVWHRQLDAPTPGLGGALVGAPAVTASTVIFLVDEASAPYAIALNRSDGSVAWRSAPIVTTTNDYTNASAVVANGILFMGYSELESNSKSSGGFALLDARSGRILKVTPTIPPADQAKGYGGGGIWSTPAYDPASRYAYVGAGNPSSRELEHAHTNAILKVDLDRSRATFGQIVASYKGNVDQYAQALEAASQTPVCAVSDQPQAQYPLDDPACGQIDLDFGAPPNLFTSGGRLLVGELQKSGVYHVAHADTMSPAWTALVGASCGVCNAAATAFDGHSIIGEFTPGGVLEAITPSGTTRWRTPVGDLVHFQGVSTAAGVAYTIDSGGYLDAFDATTGATLTRRAVWQDTRTAMMQLESTGVAIAAHTVFVTATATTNAGYLIAYR